MANVYIATGTLYLNGTTYEYGEVVAEGDVPADRLRTLIRRGLIDISSDGGGGGAVGGVDQIGGSHSSDGSASGAPTAHFDLAPTCHRVKAGDAIVVVGASRYGGAPVPTAPGVTFTEVVAWTAWGSWAWLGFVTEDGDAPLVTVTPPSDTATYFSASVAVFRGVSQTTPVDVTPWNGGYVAAALNRTFSNVQTSITDNSMAVVVVATSDDNSPVIAGSDGWQQQYSLNLAADGSWVWGVNPLGDAGVVPDCYQWQSGSDSAQPIMFVLRAAT